MAVAGTGQISLRLDEFEDLLAASSSFRTWTGAEDAAAAHAFIHRCTFSDDEQGDATDAAWRTSRAAKRPLAVVSIENAHGRLVGAPNAWGRGGAVRVVFEAMADSGEAGLSDEDAIVTFYNTLGAVLSDLEADTTTPAPLITAHRIMRPAARMDPAEVAAGALDVIQCEVEISWGS